MQKFRPLIEVTPIAKSKLTEVLDKQKGEGSYLRIEVFQSGGCACSGGYRYAMSLEEKPRESDIVEKIDGFKIATDKQNAELLRGSKIDFYESMQRTGFKIENPNIHAESCGCGGH